LCVNFLAYVCLQGPMVLFPVYVRSRGGTTATISHMWMYMLSLETVLMISAATLYKRLGAKAAITAGVLACSLRWALCGLCHDLRWVYPLQMLHGVMVVSLQVGSPMLVESLVPDRLRASSQAGLNLLGSGLGAIISTTLAGLALDAWGIDTVMLLFGCAGLVLSAFVPCLLPRQPEPGTQASHGVHDVHAAAQQTRQIEASPARR
jgi:MFS family permease